MKSNKIITLLCLTALLSGCNIVIYPAESTSSQQTESQSSEQSGGGASSESQGGTSQGTSESQGQESQGGSSGSQEQESQGGSSESSSQGGTSQSSEDTQPSVHNGMSVETAYSVEEMIEIMSDFDASQATDYDIYVRGKVATSAFNTKYSSFKCYFEGHEENTAKPFFLYDGVLTNSLKGQYTDLTGKIIVFHGKALLYQKGTAFIYEIARTNDNDSPIIDIVEGGSTPTSETGEQTSESSQTPPESTDPVDYSTLEGDPINSDPVAQQYYSGISKTATGETLRSQLQTLINKNRCSTGYDSLWNYYPYSDADPDHPEVDSVVAFYDGTAEKNYRSEMNKEHVWPKSRGGHAVDGDPHMTRPTYSKDNSSRGNSFYVEGMNHSKNGWDPKTAGMNENYRGDAARIIFYCAVANSNLKLVDTTYEDTIDTTHGSMGKLSDLIKWNYTYPISKYERFRNEVLSGERTVRGTKYNFNRNPFIDDRSLVCRIWGDTNSTTRELCALYTKQVKPTSLTLNEESITIPNDATYQLSVESVTPANAAKTVTWSSSDPTVATVNNGLVTALKDGVTDIVATSTEDSSIKATCHVTVHTENVELQSISVSSSLEIFKGKTGKVGITLNPSNSYPTPTIEFESNNTTIATVSSDGTVTGVKVGQTTISVTVRQNAIVKNGTCNITVSESTQQEVTDTITPDMLNATSTVYTDFNGVRSESDAVYSGHSAKSDNGGFIQLRTKNATSGIVAIASGGNVKSVKITVGDGNKQVNVYVSNTPYTSASDLFDEEKCGTLAGSLTSTGTINIQGDYQYVGIRSDNGAIYLAKIEIVWA